MLWIKNDLVNLVCLGHNNTVPLNNHCVCVHPALKSDDDDDNLDFDFDLDLDLTLTLIILSLILMILTLIFMILSHR